MKLAEPIILSPEECSTIDAWSTCPTTSFRRAGRSFPYRLVQRARIIRMAAGGILSQDIAKELHISRPTVQLWRQRFLFLRLSGLEKDAPRPGRKPRIQQRKINAIIEATLHTTPPDATHWSTRSMAKALGVSKATVCPDMATAQSQATSCRDIQTQSRQAVCRETSRYRWAISQSARQSTGLVCRRKESDPSSRPNATFITFTPRPSGASDTRLYTARNDNFIRCLEHARWKGHRRLHAQTPASRIYPVLTTRKCQNPAGFGFASYRRQLWCSQAPTGHKLAQASSSVPLALYSNIQFMAEYGGTLVPGNYRQTYSPWFIQKRSGSNQGNYAVSRQSQPKSTRFYLERISRTDYGKDRQM